jgi:septum formation protein
MKIILGSASKNRRKILESKGLIFDVMSPDIDERAIRDPDPGTLVLKIARAKADLLLPRIHEDALLITSDQVACSNGEIIEKPQNADDVRRFLTLIGGNLTQTVTAVVVANTKTGERKEGVDIGTVWFRKFPKDFIEQIVANPRTYELAGGFDIDDPLFEAYVDRIEGERESIIAIPWALTKRLLQEAA